MDGAPQAVCMGELLIDFMASPRAPRLEDAQSFIPKPGGAPANVAVGIQRLGKPSAFVGMVGDDAFGRLLRGVLESERVDTRSLATSVEQPTTLAFVALDDAGKPDFSFYRHPGADLSLRIEDVDRAVYDAARVFHFGSLSLTATPAADTTRTLLALARERGHFTTYDPNYRPALWPSPTQARTAMLQPLVDVDLLKVSEEELQLLTGESDLVVGCQKMAANGPRCVVVSRGQDGLFGWMDGESFVVPGLQVDVQDTTGCGDASMAGIIASLLDAYPDLNAATAISPKVFQQSLDFANRCAALTATRLGAIPALPTQAEVSGFRP